VKCIIGKQIVTNFLKRESQNSNIKQLYFKTYINDLVFIHFDFLPQFRCIDFLFYDSNISHQKNL